MWHWQETWSRSDCGSKVPPVVSAAHSQKLFHQKYATSPNTLLAVEDIISIKKWWLSLGTCWNKLLQLSWHHTSRNCPFLNWQEVVSVYFLALTSRIPWSSAVAVRTTSALTTPGTAGFAEGLSQAELDGSAARGREGTGSFSNSPRSGVLSAAPVLARSKRDQEGRQPWLPAMQLLYQLWSWESHNLL